MIKAAFYQFNPLFGRVEENINKVFTALRKADPGLLVLPEFFATGYQFISRDEVAKLSEEIPGGYTTQRLINLSRKKNLHIVAGLPERDGRRFFNSAILVGPAGFIGTYRKTHLFFEEKLYFSAGDTGFRIWDTGIGRIGIMICFDWFFPESMRVLSLMGADIVAHPANLVLPYCPLAMPVRCLENRVYAVTANRIGEEKRKEEQALRFIGQSRIVSPEGNVLVTADAHEEALMVIELDLEKARNKALNPANNLFTDRRPEMYLNLTEQKF
jgi:predicted amidohydrolase